jgi:hypothetical protein
MAGSGQGEDSSTAGRFLPGRWGWLLIWTGALALISMTEIGHVLAVIAMISVIGIPIYFLLAALPSIFLILLFLRFVFGVIDNFRSRAAWAVGFAFAALFMVNFFVVRAYRENVTLDARAAALVADDVDVSKPIPAGGVIAIVRSEAFASRREAEDVCDDVCQRLLLNGFAKRILVATLSPQIDTRAPRSQGPLPALEPSLAMRGVMYWLEERTVCPDTKVPENVRILQVSDPQRVSGVGIARSAAEAMRVKIAMGNCLISAPARLEEADGAFFYGPTARGNAGLLRGFDPTVDTVSAWRTAYFIRDGANWSAEQRATGVRYSRFPDALIPTYVHGHQLKIYNGYLRDVRYLGGRSRYEENPPVVETLTRLGVPLQFEDVGRSDGPKIVDEALATKGELSPMQSTIIDDYFRRLSLNRNLRLAPEDVRRVVALLADTRVGFNWSAQGAVTMVAQQQPQMAVEIAGLLFKRLDALVASAAVVSEEVNLNTRSVSSALAALPANVLKPYFSNIEAVALSPGLRPSAQPLIARLDIFGSFAVPTMFRVIDESLAERVPRGPSNWSSGFTAGLRALCGLGGEAAFARRMLEERIARDGAAFTRANDRLLIATLARMGASEAEIRETLGIDEKNQSRIRYAMRAANGPNACQ